MPRVTPNKPSTSRKKGERNSHQAARSVPQWQPHLSQYADQRILTFSSPQDLEAAIDLLWTDHLRSLPHDTPDGNALVVPAEAVACFSRAGLQFTQESVLSVSDLSAEEIQRLRR